MDGKLQAKALTSIVPSGNYVYIGGASTDYNAHLLKKGVFDVLKPFIQKGDITVVYDQWTDDWEPEHAYTNMLYSFLLREARIRNVRKNRL